MFTVAAICSPDCDNGNCTEPGVCSCDEGWNGTTCSDGKFFLYQLYFFSQQEY